MHRTPGPTSRFTLRLKQGVLMMISGVVMVEGVGNMSHETDNIILQFKVALLSDHGQDIYMIYCS